jgi:hypothetical protein
VLDEREQPPYDAYTAIVAAFLGGLALGEEERPTGTGLQRAIRELVTCTRCVGTWTAAGLASTQVLTPRFGRL